MRKTPNFFAYFSYLRCRLRKTSPLVAFYSDSSYLSKFTEFGKIPVKNSDPKKVLLTVTAKVKGKLDALSPDSAVLLTPNVKNGFGIDLSDPGQVQLAFLRKEGSRYDDAADIFTAEANEEGTGFLIRLSPGSSVDVGKDRFFVSVRVTDPSDPTREAQ